MSKNSRKCPNCGATVEGRPNKIFCNDICKGRHFRNTASTEYTDEVSEPILVTQSFPFRQLSTTKLVDEEDEAQEEAAEKARQYQEQASTLHVKFGTLVRELLEYAGKTLTARRIRSLRSDAAQLSADYAAHPFIKSSNTQIRSRLKALYDINDTLQETAEEIESKMSWQRQEGVVEISKKWRKHLRELLIED